MLDATERDPVFGDDPDLYIAAELRLLRDALEE